MFIRGPRRVMNIRAIYKIFLIVPSVLLASHVHSQQVLRLSGIEGSINHRIGSAILKKAYENIGVDIDTVELPAKRSLVMADAGVFDGEVQRIGNINRQYPNLIEVPEPILYLESSVFVKNPRIRIEKWDELSSYLIGIPRGIMYLNNQTAGMNRVLVKNLDQLFYLLDVGRIDVVIISTNYGRTFLENHKHMNIKMLEPPILRTPLFHYLHRKHRTLVPRIAESIRQMRKHGVIEEIITKYTHRN